MDLRELKARYGKDVVFWGGAVNTQQTLPFGTPDQVAQEVREVLDIMCPGGGYVVNPIHNILPEVPIENVLALYQTANAYRYS
jgi:uroporphyrinogen-III decarboxylase